jgi:hypothetical protein
MKNQAGRYNGKGLGKRMRKSRKRLEERAQCERKR